MTLLVSHPNARDLPRLLCPDCERYSKNAPSNRPNERSSVHDSISLIGHNAHLDGWLAGV
jgi:hypothetical protein